MSVKSVASIVIFSGFCAIMRFVFELGGRIEENFGVVEYDVENGFGPSGHHVEELSDHFR